MSRKRTKLVTDADILPYATKQTLLTYFNNRAIIAGTTRATKCILYAGISKGMFIIGATMYSAKGTKLKEYAAVGEDLIDALYSMADVTQRKEYVVK